MNLDSVFGEENQENNTDELINRMFNSANFPAAFGTVWPESQKRKADVLDVSESAETATSSDAPPVKRPRKPIKAPREQSHDPRAAEFSHPEDGIYMNAEFKTWDAFNEKFRNWMAKHNQPFRISSSDKFSNGDGSWNEEIGYRSIVYHCPRYGEVRVRGEGKRSKQQYLPCHCTATIRLNYHSATQVLRITTFRPLHNHELSYEEYTKLTNKRKSTVGPASPLTVQASSASTSGVSSNGTSPAGTVSPIQVSPTEISSPKSGLDIGLAGLPGLTAQTKEILAMASQQKEFSPVSGQIKDTDGPKIATPAKNLAQSGQKISPSPSKPSPSSLSPVQAPQQLPPQLLPEGKLVKKDENSNIYTLQDQKIAADVANQWIQAALAIKMENKQPAPEPVQPAESQNFQSALVQLLLNDPNQLRQLLEAENQRRLEQKRREEELARLRTPNLANLLQLAGFLKQNPQGSSNIPSQDEILRKLMENCAQNGNLGVSSEEEESRSNAEYGLSTGLSQSTAGINLKSGQSQGQQTAPAGNQIIHPTQNQPQIAQSAFKHLLSAQQPTATSISGISSLNQPIYPSNFGFSPQIPLNSQNSTPNSAQSASELASTWMKMYSQQMQSQTNGIGHQNLKTNQGEDQEGARQLLNLLQALQPQNGISQ